MAKGKEGVIELVVMALLAALVLVLAIPMLTGVGQASEQAAVSSDFSAQSREASEIAPR